MNEEWDEDAETSEGTNAKFEDLMLPELLELKIIVDKIYEDREFDNAIGKNAAQLVSPSMKLLSNLKLVNSKHKTFKEIITGEDMKDQDVAPLNLTNAQGRGTCSHRSWWSGLS